MTHQAEMVKTPLDQVVEVIAKGKRCELARLLDLNRSTITGWDNPQRRAKNMCGCIPVEYFPKIRALYAARGLVFDPTSHLPT